MEADVERPRSGPVRAAPGRNPKLEAPAAIVPFVDEPETTRAWLAKASEDLAGSALLIERGLTALGAFHAQQAAEKSLKALRIHRKLGLTKSHDLDRLADGLGLPEDLLQSCSLLTTYYTSARYPDVEGVLAIEEARAALAGAEEVVAWCRKQIS